MNNYLNPIQCVPYGRATILARNVCPSLPASAGSWRGTKPHHTFNILHHSNGWKNYVTITRINLMLHTRISHVPLTSRGSRFVRGPGHPPSCEFEGFHEDFKYTLVIYEGWFSVGSFFPWYFLWESIKTVPDVTRYHLWPPLGFRGFAKSTHIYMCRSVLREYLLLPKGVLRLWHLFSFLCLHLDDTHSTCIIHFFDI